MRVSIAVLAFSGCAQVLGIDNTTGAAASSSLELRRASIGSTVVTGPQDLAAVPTFYAGAMSGAGMAAGPGQWTGTITGVTAIAYKPPDLPMPFTHVLELPVGAAKADFVAFEHPSPEAAPATSLAVDVMLPTPYAAGESFLIAAIGTWMQHALSGAEVPMAGGTQITAMIPYSMFTPTAGNMPTKIAMADTVVVLRYTGNDLTGALVVPPFAQDASSMLAGTMTASMPATPFDATIDPTGAATRMGMVMPAVSGVSANWHLDAAPGYSEGATLGVALTRGTVAMTATSITGMYSNPFDAQQWKPVLTYSVNASRTFTLGGASLGLGTQLVGYADPTTGGNFDLPAGLPTKVSIGGTELTTDGMSVSLDPSMPTTITITADRATNAYYVASIQDIAVVGTTVTRTTIASITGTTPTLQVPPGTLVRGHTYAILAKCGFAGYTKIGSGDLQTFSYPASEGLSTGGVFTLAP